MIISIKPTIRLLGIVVLFLSGVATALGADLGVKVKAIPGDWQINESQLNQRFLLTNETNSKRNVTIELRKEAFSADRNGPENYSRSIELPPNGTSSLLLSGPNYVAGHYALAITVDDKPFSEEDIKSVKQSMAIMAYSNQVMDQITVCLSQLIPGNIGTFPAEVSTPGHGRMNVKYLAATRSSRDYLSTASQFYGASLLILRSEELTTMNEQAREELFRAIAMGLPAVFVGTPPQLPDVEWNSSGMNPNIQCGSWRFGKLFAIPTVPETWNPNEWQEFLSTAALRQTGAIRRATSNSVTSLIGMQQRTPPFLLLVGMMVAFTLLVGPVNYGILAKKRKLILIVVTVPIISIVCTGVNAAIIWAWEGIKLDIYKDSITLLDQTRHEAVTLGTIGFYSPTNQSNLSFRDDIELTVSQSMPLHNSSVDTTSGTKILGNYITPRQPGALSQASCRYRSEEVKVVKIEPKKSMEIVNGLGGKIKMLIAIGPDGEMYRSNDPIAPGQRATLDYINSQSDSSIDDELTSLYNDLWFGFRIEPKMLKHNMYSATLERSPFLETGTDVAPREEKALVIGKYNSPGEQENVNEN